VDDIAETGRALRSFPSKVGDDYRYECGSENPAKRYNSYFLLRAYTTDNLGHCAIQIVINLNNQEPEEGKCSFSIRAEVAAINRLGELFEQFGRLDHLEFHWNLKDGQLYEEHQQEKFVTRTSLTD
jgi:hypothetical protein